VSELKGTPAPLISVGVTEFTSIALTVNPIPPEVKSKRRL
jgi:hypothetical protein